MPSTLARVLVLDGDTRLAVKAAAVASGPPARAAPGTLVDDRLTVACGTGALRLTGPTAGQGADGGSRFFARLSARRRPPPELSHGAFQIDPGIRWRPFVGWQRQDNGPSVQAALEDALRALTGNAVEVVGAGRTDAGVHALGQVAHIDLVDERFDGRKLREALNYHLKPAPIAVLEAAPAPSDFHARFSATARAYLYIIVNRRAPLAIDRGRAWQVRQPLDVAAMAAAAEPLLGHHDFTSFPGCPMPSQIAVQNLGPADRHPRRR